MDDAALRKTLGPRVPRALDLAPEAQRALAPTGASAVQKLARREVARMGRDNVKKTGLGAGVAESFEPSEMGGRHIHSVRISRVSSCSSRIRRRRDASSARP